MKWFRQKAEEGQRADNTIEVSSTAITGQLAA
jgi:hypothetical protein